MARWSSFLLLAVGCLVASHASAQRRARRAPPAPAPAVVSLSALAGDADPHVRTLSIRASAPVEIAADRRWLWLEVTPAGARRALRCEHPDRSAEPARRVSLSSGAAWSEWVDVREYCWGRALAALDAGGAQVVVHYGRRGRGRGRAVARFGDPAVDATELPTSTLSFAAVTREAAPDPSAPLVVRLSDADTASGRSLGLRLAVLGRDAARRAYVRPDRVRFEVRPPEGAPFTCAMSMGGGAATPDLFRTFRRGAGVHLALDASQYCRDAFDAPGVYEVVPVLTLDQDGASYEIDAVTGELTGAPALVRVRRGRRGHIERADVPAAPR